MLTGLWVKALEKGDCQRQSVQREFTLKKRIGGRRATPNPRRQQAPLFIQRG
jgi:hypothetical protein